MPRKLLKGGNYSREETIHGNTVYAVVLMLYQNPRILICSNHFKKKPPEFFPENHPQQLTRKVKQKPSRFKHLNLRTTLFTCFVLKTLCSKTKHLSSVLWSYVHQFKWILGTTLLATQGRRKLNAVLVKIMLLKDLSCVIADKSLFWRLRIRKCIILRGLLIIIFPINWLLATLV